MEGEVGPAASLLFAKGSPEESSFEGDHPPPSDDDAERDLDQDRSAEEHSHNNEDGLKRKIFKQVEYYFSDENLLTDKYMIGLMKKNREGFDSVVLGKEIFNARLAEAQRRARRAQTETAGPSQVSEGLSRRPVEEEAQPLMVVLPEAVIPARVSEPMGSESRASASRALPPREWCCEETGTAPVEVLEETPPPSKRARTREAEELDPSILFGVAAEGSLPVPSECVPEEPFPDPEVVAPPPQEERKKKKSKGKEKVVDESQRDERPKPWSSKLSLREADSVGDIRTVRHYLQHMFTPRDLSRVRQLKLRPLDYQELAAQHILKGLLYLHQSHATTSAAIEEQKKQAICMVDQANALAMEERVARARAQEENKDLKVRMKRLEEAMAKEAAEKDKAIADRDARIRELEEELGQKTEAIEKAEVERTAQAQELEAKFWDQVQTIKKSHASTLAEVIAEKDKLYKRLRHASKKYEREKQALELWVRWEANIPSAVVSTYVQSSEFKEFIQQVGTEGYLTGALAYREAILKHNLASVVEGADSEVPVVGVPSGVNEVPPPPRFSLSSVDLDAKVSEGVFAEAVVHPGKDGEVGTAERGAGGTPSKPAASEVIPPGEPSILDRLEEELVGTP